METFVNETFDLAYEKRILVLSTDSNRHIYGMKKRHKVNFRCNDKEFDNACYVFGPPDGVCGFILALISYAHVDDETNTNRIRPNFVDRSNLPVSNPFKQLHSETFDNASSGTDSSILDNQIAELYVGNLPIGAQSRELYDLFKEFEIESNGINIITKKQMNVSYAFVRFTNKETLNKVLNGGRRTLRGNVLKLEECRGNSVSKRQSSSTNDENESVENGGGSIDGSSLDSISIIVSNIPRNTSAIELIRIFNKFGLLNKPPIRFLNRVGSAYVNFCSSTSVNKLMTSPVPLVLKGVKLEIKQVERKSKKPTLPSTAFVENEKGDVSDVAYFTVNARNLPNNANRLAVYNVFKKFGRIIEPPGVVVDKFKREASIPFSTLEEAESFANRTVYMQQTPVRCFFDAPNLVLVSSETAQKTTEKGNEFEELDQTCRTLNGMEIQEWLDFVKKSSDTWNNGILVRNVNRLSSSALVKQYFQNRRSGGGVLLNHIVQAKFDRAILVFENANCVNAVLSRRHELENQNLHATKLSPIKEDGFLLYNVPPQLTVDRLKNYLQNTLSREVESIDFCNQDGTWACVDLVHPLPFPVVVKHLEENPWKNGSDERCESSSRLVVLPMLRSNTLILKGNFDATITRLTVEQLLKHNYSSQPTVDVICNVAKIKSDDDTILKLILSDCEFVDYLTSSDDLCCSTTVAVETFVDEIGFARVKDFTFRREYESARVVHELTEIEYEFLSTKKCRKVVDAHLTDNNWNCFWNVETVATKNHLVVITEEKFLSETIKDGVLSLFETVTYPLDEPMLSAWQRNGASFVKDTAEKVLGDLFRFTLNNVGLNITVFGAKTVTEGEKLLDDFFAAHAKYKKVVMGKSATEDAEYVRSFLVDDLRSQYAERLDITVTKDGQLEAYGSEQDRSKLIDSLNSTKFSLIAQHYSLTASLAAFFASKEGSDELNRISVASKCFLRLVDAASNKVGQSATNANQRNQLNNTNGSFKYSPGVYTKLPSPYSFSSLPFTLNGCEIFLLKSSIVQTDSDIIVNGTGNNPFSSGELSREIFQAAGLNVMQEMRRIYNGALQDLSVTATSGGRLNCKSILHVVCETWTASDNLSGLRDIVERCLEFTTDSGCSSISFPALGTGNRRYPNHAVAKTMLSAIIDWNRKRQSKQFVTVTFVFSPDNACVYDEFEAEMKRRWKTTVDAERLASFNDRALGKFKVALFHNAAQDIFSTVARVETKHLKFLSIYGPLPCIEKARKKLDEVVDSNFDKIDVSHKFISDLRKEDLFDLKRTIEIDGTKFLFNTKKGAVTVVGLNANVYAEKLRELFEKLDEETATPFSTKNWYYRLNNGSSWKHFLPVDDARLEKRYAKYANDKQALEMFLSPWALPVDLNFWRMELTVTSSVATVKACQKFYIKRHDANSVIPVDWVLDENSKEDYILVELDSSSEEYLHVKELIGSSVKITSIERIENPTKYRQYFIEKRKVSQSLPIGFDVEKFLFYFMDSRESIAEGKLSNICNHGFDRSEMVSNGDNFYGNGCQFHRKFLYQNPVGKSKALCVRVLTGDFITGKPGLKTAPPKPTSTGGTTIPKQYDSVVDDLKNPNIFVVFSDNHSYPAYVITYQRPL